MIHHTITTLTLGFTLATTSLAAPGDRPFKKQLRTINKAVVAIVDSRSDEVLTHGTTVGKDIVVTKASEIGDVPQEYLAIRAKTSLKVATNWTDEKNDLAVLSTEGQLPAPADLSFTGKLLQGKILTTVTGGKEAPKAGIVSVPAREIEMRNGVLGVGLQIFRRRENHPVIITEVFPGGGAEAAGLEPGDTILSIDDKGVGNSRQLIDTVFSRLPGEIVKLRILRDDSEFDQDVKLAHMTVLDPVDFIRARNIQISGPISKRVSGFTHAIQHDIALTPQEMGTPLIDTSGQVVAINIARADRLTTYALPVAIVRTAIEAATAQSVEGEPEPAQAPEPEPEPEPELKMPEPMPEFRQKTEQSPTPETDPELQPEQQPGDKPEPKQELEPAEK